ncbi:MAG: hypothetical protein KAI24_16680 [Planctomycetes bacterium]|nr:hypothetical protein [Planctomycetota bacterium]
MVVETDAARGDYDARLAELLAEAERRAELRLPFPRHHGLSPEQLGRGFRRVEVRAGPDRSWHFELTLPRSANVAAARPSAASDRPHATLASVQLDQLGSSIDVVAARRVDGDLPAWLDDWLAQVGMVPFSSRPRRTARGLMADVLATRAEAAGTMVARYVSVRPGPRTYLLILRSPAVAYRFVAREFLVAVESLAPLRAAGGQPRGGEGGAVS